MTWALLRPSRPGAEAITHASHNDGAKAALTISRQVRCWVSHVLVWEGGVAGRAAGFREGVAGGSAPESI